MLRSLQMRTQFTTGVGFPFFFPFAGRRGGRGPEGVAALHRLPGVQPLLVNFALSPAPSVLRKSRAPSHRCSLTPGVSVPTFITPSSATAWLDGTTVPCYGATEESLNNELPGIRYLIISSCLKGKNDNVQTVHI